jgi:hypothetical protein
MYKHSPNFGFPAAAQNSSSCTELEPRVRATLPDAFRLGQFVNFHEVRPNMRVVVYVHLPPTHLLPVGQPYVGRYGLMRVFNIFFSLSSCRVSVWHAQTSSHASNVGCRRFIQVNLSFSIDLNKKVLICADGCYSSTHKGW